MYRTELVCFPASCKLHPSSEQECVGQEQVLGKRAYVQSELRLSPQQDVSTSIEYVAKVSMSIKYTVQREYVY